MSTPLRQFDVDYGSIVNVLKTPVKASEAFDPNKVNPSSVKLKQYNAIWDTGATNTVITKKVVQDLGLQPIGKTNATGVNSSQVVDTYLINLHLPNNVGFQAVRVAELPVQGSDVLIGMDIIRHGDLAISNVGKTVFSFRVPSTQSSPITQSSPSTNNNSQPASGNNKPHIADKPERNAKVKIRNKKTGEEQKRKYKHIEDKLEPPTDWELVG